MADYSKLIYGKNPLKNVVSVEIKDDVAEIFVQQADGSVKSVFYPNKFWILSSTWMPDSVKLNGNLHYKYALFFKERDKFLESKWKLGKRDTFSIYNEKESYLIREGVSYNKGLKPTEISVLSFDIETDGLRHTPESQVFLISNTFRKNGIITKKLFSFDEYTSQGEMIESWCEWVRKMDPSFIIGHNINNFDFGYLHHVAGLTGHGMSLGRDGSNIEFSNYESKFRLDGTRDLLYHRVKIYGREIIDTMFLSYKYDIARNFDSYGLKPIIKQLGLEKKDRVFYDASLIKYNYKNPVEFTKIKEYAKDDADDALALFDLMIPPFFYMSQSIPKPIQLITESASGSMINSLMMRAYLQDSHSLPKESEVSDFEGAISLGSPGIFRNCLKVDVASLYPSIMREYKVFDKEKDPKEYFLRIVDYFTEERLKNKKLWKETGDPHYDHLQNSTKILINSMYGFLSTNGLLFNSPKNAAFVTKKGREILEQATMFATGCVLKHVPENEEKSDEKLRWAVGDRVQDADYILVNADTDSITICRNDMKEISKVEQEDFLQRLNAQYPEKIRFEHDGYFPTMVVLKAKNYIMWDGEKLKLKGGSMKSAKLELALKDFQHDIIQSIIDGKEDYTDIYHRYIRESQNITDIKPWSSKKTVSEKTLTSNRTNESRILDAIGDTDIQIGDKVWVFFRTPTELSLVENFDGVYDKDKMLERVFSTCKIFANVLPTEKYFINYKLKKNKKLLEDILKQS